MRDSTARHAEKAVTAGAMTDTLSLNGAEPFKISRATARTIMGSLDIQYSPSTGEIFATIKENAPDLVQQGEGQSPKKGNNS